MDIQMVARVANVSTATISRVINGSPKVKPETFKKVQDIIEKLNYVPNNSARSLRVGRSHLLGLIVSDINNPFFPQLIDEFESRAMQQGIDVIFTHTNYQASRLGHCLKRLIERNVDGIAICTSETNPAAFAIAQRHKRPFVLLNQEGMKTHYDNIYVDHDTGALEAVRHLRNLGHRRIGFIAGPERFESTRLRLEAFVRAMTLCKLTLKPSWIVEGDLHIEGGQLAMETLLKNSIRPTALLCTNDLMALGALRTAHLQGLDVPNDFSIIGFDNLPVCEMVTPPLSSVNIPSRSIASHAFRMLEEALRAKNGKKLPTPTVRTTLVLRSSTAPAPGSKKRAQS